MRSLSLSILPTLPSVADLMFFIGQLHWFENIWVFKKRLFWKLLSRYLQKEELELKKYSAQDFCRKVVAKIFRNLEEINAWENQSWLSRYLLGI